MVDMKNRASCCIPISAPEAEACKLLLLDGQTSGSDEFVTTKVELDNAGKSFDVCRRDRVLLYGITCTAWALLLRCYTGQDRVTFEYKSVDATSTLLRMSFDEDETLSKYTDKARDAITTIEQKRQRTAPSSAANGKTKTIPNLVNTRVCICDSNTPAELLAAKTAEKPVQVSDENPRFMIQYSQLI